MRIHEGDFAYDIEQPRDPLTQLPLSWKYRLFRVRPKEEVLASGEAETRADAEKKAKAALRRMVDKGGSKSGLSDQINLNS